MRFEQANVQSIAGTSHLLSSILACYNRLLPNADRPLFGCGLEPMNSFDFGMFIDGWALAYAQSSTTDTVSEST